MLIRSLLILVSVFVTLNVGRATDIKIKVENYEYDTLVLGYYYWDKQYIKDTLVRNDQNCFRIKQKESLPAGLYLIILQPDNEYVQMIVPEDDQKFEVQFNASNPFESLNFKKSEENQIFQDYVGFLSESRKQADLIRTENEDVERRLELVNEGVLNLQTKILKDHAQSMTALIIRINEEISPPEFEGSDTEIRDKQYQFYLNHFFDNVDLSDPRLPYTSFLFGKVERYLKKVVMQIPDSINLGLDRVLSLVENNQESFKLILVHYLNEYAASEYVGMDAVYVHLVDNYYASGKAPWVSEESLLKMKDDAAALRPLLIGKPAPKVTLYQKDGTPIDLYDIESKYLALIFWAPDCGHCKKSMPKLNSMSEVLKEEGVTIVAVCSKLLDKEATCWQYVEENGMNNWLNLTDKYLRSKYKQKYNIKSTPQVYILDEDKVILTKKIGVDKILDVVHTLKQIEEERSN